jgi:hypothetical protein
VPGSAALSFPLADQRPIPVEKKNIENKKTPMDLQIEQAMSGTMRPYIVFPLFPFGFSFGFRVVFFLSFIFFHG